MKTEQYIIKYANAKIDELEANTLLNPGIKLELQRRITHAVFLRGNGDITADEAIKMIGGFVDKQEDMTRFMTPGADVRENLLITMGNRAGHMEAAGEILIGGTTDDEDRLAEFCRETVDGYLRLEPDHDVSFDEWIERALMEKFGH